MKIVAGLGNPGPKYETTRHNVGFLAIDRLIDDWSARGPAVREQGEVWEAAVEGEKVLLIKPQTFMNESGRCIAPLARFYKCQPGDVLVLHDEVDLKFNVLRLKCGGGAAGHNGIRSIDAHLGDPNYYRARIGVGKPVPGAPGPRNTHDHVLGQFTDTELSELDRIFGRLEKAARLIIKGEAAAAMNEYNRVPEGGV